MSVRLIDLEIYQFIPLDANKDLLTPYPRSGISYPLFSLKVELMLSFDIVEVAELNLRVDGMMWFDKILNLFASMVWMLLITGKRDLARTRI